MQILLFDMDGVLIEPHGYHAALRDTVRKLGRLCGFPDADLSEEDIAAFESAGVSSEWDSSAMCLALLLKQAWKTDPEFTLPQRLGTEPAPFSGPAPDFRAFAQALEPSRAGAAMPLERAALLLLDGTALNARQNACLRLVLAQARDVPGLNFLLFQEFIAGSQAFARLYHLPPAFACASYLHTCDRPILTPAAAAGVRAWLQEPAHAAAFFTARPGTAPAPIIAAPDAESGAELLGLAQVPAAHQGRITWLGMQLGLPEQALIKPAPAHALLGILLAAGLTLEACLPYMRALTDNQPAQALPVALHGADVTVFEDSTGGMLSLQALAARLRPAGVPMQVHFCGISTHPGKRAALQSLGAAVFDDIHQALQAAAVL